MFKNRLLFPLLLVTVGIAGFITAKQQDPPFENLSSQERYQRIITERDFSIQKAVEAGDYRCCLKPPCTMCYMEPNQWNNFTAATCACDDLIAQGEEPCPQCARGLCETKSEEACQ